ncbi:MAG: HAMP domain-containing histidine kinase [Dorea sp.]|nr:HAMP domain-containing histidine kinase [Dorea sp.]
MKNGRKRRKRLFLGPVVLGFTFLYVVSMLLTTWLVKWKFVEDFEQNCAACASSVQAEIREISKENAWNANGLTENQKKHLQAVLSNMWQASDSKYQQLSGAIYDAEGSLEAKSQALLGITRYAEEEDEECKYLYYPLSDYFTEGEIEKLAEYLSESYEHKDELSKYLMWVDVGTESWDLAHVRVDEVQWASWEYSEESYNELLEGEYQYFRRNDGETEYYVSDYRTVWEWDNPEIKGETTENLMPHTLAEQILSIPEIENGISGWKQWKGDSYLQDYPETMEGGYFGYISSNNYSESASDSEVSEYQSLADNIVPIYINDDLEHIYALLLRTTTHPWLAAFAYMKYVYISGFFLMVLCAGIVISVMNKTYEKQVRLEEMRRDFTNAIAHELKTPLAVIRGFTENLKENTFAEKKDYYLDKIVEQTEEIDQMVRRMCEISKLQSDQLVLQKEQVDLLELLKEQEPKIHPLAEEKDLDIEYCVRDVFALEGDHYYLGKALLNLLSNAAEYNRREGMIRITVEKDLCSIENTGESIPEEKLAYLGNMFYSGSESRTHQEKHLGLGLYVAERILELHHLKLLIENTEEGVKVTIKKYS